MLASGSPFDAVFKMYHDAPVNVVASSKVAPLVAKNGVTGWLGSSTMEGSAAPGMPEADAGPLSPMVAYVSSAKSGNTPKNAGLIPDAFQEELNWLLNAPIGTSMLNPASSLPYTALMRSVGWTMFT